MEKRSNPLPNDIETLKSLLLSERQISAKKIEELEAQNHYLLERFRLAQHKQFGKSSETSDVQGDLFNEAEALVDAIDEPEVETISYTRNKPKRRPLPKDLPRGQFLLLQN